MNNLIAAALTHSRTVLMMFVLLIVAGAVTYVTIPKEANPDVPIPFIYVSIVHDGISPEDAERMLVKPMERELRSIDGVKEMKATAGEGFANITLEFIAGLDSKDALADVRDKVTVARAKLPSETEEPTIHEVTMAGQQAAITVVLSGPVAERALVTVARELQNRLESLSEVLEVDIGGDREDIVEIVVDPLLMESYGLDQNDIFNLLSRNNRLVPAGTMDNGKGSFAVKVPSVFESVKDVMEQPVKVVGERVITFQDVAQVRRSYKDPTSFARLNGDNSVSLEVKKRPGENLLETVANVKGLIEGAQQTAIWPSSVYVSYTGDQSVDVNMMLGDLQNNVSSAVILVAVVIVAILGLRTAILVGVSIPGSFLTGILIIAMFGYTLNTVVLFSLIMAVGMLVDGAIVVTEYADRCMGEGANKQQAYLKAAQRMAWPIIASTATTLAAFAPLMFWPGMMGEFMKYLPFTLIAVLSASLVMALVFVPTLGAVFGKPQTISAKAKEQMLLAENGDLSKLTGFTGRYVRLLAKAISHPWKVLLIAFVVAGLSFFAYFASGLGLEFFPKVDSSGINVTVRSSGDMSIYEKDTIVQEVEQKLIDMDAIETLYARTGGRDQIGYLRLNLVDWHLRPHSDEVLKETQQRLSAMAGLDIEITPDQNGPQSGKDLQIQLSSRYPELLNTAALKVRHALDENDKFTSISDTASQPGIEWQLKVNRADAARFGADATLVGSTVQFVTNGLKIGEYRPDDVDDELDIRVRYPIDSRFIGKLDELRMKTSTGMVPITNFVQREAQPKTDLIRHVDSQRVITVEANMAPGELLSIELPKLQTQLPDLNLDPRVSLTVKGQNEEQAESEGFLVNAFLVALFVMAIILVTQFNSFYQAFLILSAVLFSTVGVFLGLAIFQKPFGIVMSGIGVIALAGIVVNNNIVLIDTYNILRKEGYSATDAILRTGAQRLRPVLMTTVTTILGLLPMVAEINIDFIGRNVDVGGPSTQWWSQLATAVAGGLAFATLLTLVLTPSLLALKARREQRKITTLPLTSAQTLTSAEQP
ncbi:efflux RND transporter permease subunit [Paraglaciecola polaris]|uniref:Acriflavin resistance protein n=1 Tax=Paraglaciecola polaris LMG 21857 TaxID=1129793 RepID=K6ZGW9_9ALTE|nr:efflux RND transporter permease subunit [Paraglaciecola polaris]GAC35256.1 acriflavin resistance protein [Paraglaciecola polaris LMG 21857]|tara:strand:+ start:23916 stop:27059 length:3144 start_codon:yes stop_codon:yes gene_type:complete